MTCPNCERMREKVRRLARLLSPMPEEGPCLPRGDVRTGGVVGRHGWDANGAPVEPEPMPERWAEGSD